MDNTRKFIKTFLINAGITVAMLAPLTAGFIFLRSYIIKTSEAIFATRKEIAEKTASLDTFVRLWNQNNKFGDKNFIILKNIVPEKDRLIDLSQQIQSLASKDNLGFGFSFQNEITPSPPKLGYIEFILNLNAQNIDQITSFINRLLNFRYLTTINKVSIKRVGSGINGQITARTYYR